MLTEFSRIIDHMRAAEALAQSLDDQQRLGLIYTALTHYFWVTGDHQHAAAIGERARAIAAASGDVGMQILLFLPLAASLLAVSYALCGRLAESVPLWEQGVEQAVSQGKRPPQAPWGVWLGEAQLLAGCLEEVQQLAQRALTLSQLHQERGNQAYALRLLGESAARRDPPDVESAASHYRQALAFAAEMGMRPLQAHCHHGLGRLYGQTGRRELACAALSTAIEMYRTMEMTFWLPQVEAALAQVA